MTDTHNSVFAALAARLCRVVSFRHLFWRWHGLGMLQAELDEAIRIHVWHPELRRVKGLRAVHDHRFDIDSAVVYGSIIDVPYVVLVGTQPFWHTQSAGNGFVLTQAYSIVHAKAHRADVSDTTLIGEAWSKEMPVMRHAAGSTYRIARRDWHTTRVEGLAVTVVHRGNFDDKPARVLGSAESGIVEGHYKMDWSGHADGV